MAVLPTMTEPDLLTIGVMSFGARRKLSLLVKEMNIKKQTQFGTASTIGDPTCTTNMIAVSSCYNLIRTLKSNEWL